MAFSLEHIIKEVDIEASKKAAEKGDGLRVGGGLLNDHSKLFVPIKDATYIPTTDLHRHPKNIYQVEKMTQSLVELLMSIASIGVQEPLVVRKLGYDGYEIISGHRRHYCAVLLGIPSLPCIIKEYSDDEALELINALNISRDEEEILPSEKAKVLYNMNEARKRRGQEDPDVKRLLNDETFLAQIQMQKSQMYRWISLLSLIPELLNHVDNNIISLRAAYDLATIEKDTQEIIAVLISENVKYTPDYKQADALKKLQKMGKLNEDTLEMVLIKKMSLEQIVSPEKNEEKKAAKQKKTVLPEEVLALVPVAVKNEGRTVSYITEALTYYQQYIFSKIE